MGDPKKSKSRYSGPGHPWQRERIEEEKQLLKEYGLKNKKEIFQTQSRLKGYASLAKKLIAARGEQSEKEKKQFMARLSKMGLIKADAQLDDVLGLQIRNVLERRLQTLLVRKGLARTMRQARQYIAHEHVLIGSKIISAPSYHVLLDEEPNVAFIGTSALASTAHPERALPPKAPEPPKPKEEPRHGGRRPVRRQRRPVAGRTPKKPAAKAGEKK